jgi:hypothetical protein
VRPFFEDVVSLDRIFDSGNKALLGELVIPCKEESKLVETVHVVSKETTEVCAGRI